MHPALTIGGYLLGGFLTAGALVCRTQYRYGRGTVKWDSFLDDCGDLDEPYLYLVGLFWPIFLAVAAPIGICLLAAKAIGRTFGFVNFRKLGEKHRERDFLRAEQDREKQRLLEVYSKEIDQMLEERR